MGILELPRFLMVKRVTYCMKWMQWLIALLVVTSFGVGFYYYDAVPDYMVSHWNAAGEPDGYMEKSAGLFFLPVLLVIFVAIFYVIPHIDPLKENIKKFDRYYQGFIVLFVFILSYSQVLMVAWNIGYIFEISRMMAPVLGLLFVYLGILCGKCRQNWFIGVRTPWTLSSERVWTRTHNIAKDVFIAIGLIWIAVGILAPGYTPYLIGLLIIAVIGLFVDSYFEYKRELGGRKRMELGATTAPVKTRAGKVAAAKKAAAPRKRRVKKKAVKKPRKKTAKKKAVEKK